MQRNYPQLIPTANPYQHQITYSFQQPEAPDQPPQQFSQYILTDPSSSDKQDISAIDDLKNKYIALRASTAPVRPLNDIQQFRRSSDFLLIQHTVICSSQLIQNDDGKYDLDSQQGQRACKKFLNQVQRLFEVFKIRPQTRDYRNDFSKAYRVLYKEGSLSYLNQILDSAQEGFPYLYVNGQKYNFSVQVLDAGSRLYHSFCSTQHQLREIYDKAYQDTCPVATIINELSNSLKEFDSNWVQFQKRYVHQLMVIEADARRFIIEAIKLERQLYFKQHQERSKGKLVIESQKFNSIRRGLVSVIGKINSVANIEGKGRDDLTVDVLITAEGLFRRMSTVQSRAVRNLADSIKKSFINLRVLLRKYDKNIQIVDPQLKNNPELVEALSKFENSWERGKSFFQNQTRCSQLIFFSNMIDKLGEKYPSFKEQLECSDSQLFVSIPGLLILRHLENTDKDICRHFCPVMFDQSNKIGFLLKKLKRSFALGKLACVNDQQYIDLLQMGILGVQLPDSYRQQVIDNKFDNLDYTLNKIKTLATSLHRYKPVDWNKFLDVSLVFSNQMADISPPLKAKFIQQAQIELTACLMYELASQWFGERYMTGIQKVMRKESEQEKGHFEQMLDYLTLRGEDVKILPADLSSAKWTEEVSVFQFFMQLETDNYHSLSNLLKLARAEGDVDAERFLFPYVEHQVESIDEWEGYFEQAKVFTSMPGLIWHLDAIIK